MGSDLAELTPAAAVETASVLVVEDKPADALLAAQMLGGGLFEVTHAATAADAVEALLGQRFSCVLLDLGLPDARELDALHQVRTAAIDVPVVVLTARADDELAVHAVREGAQDVLVKGSVDDAGLQRAVSLAIERKRVEAGLTH